MIIPRLAAKSLANRRVTAMLTVFSIALSVFLLLGVEKLRTGAKQSFLQTISGTDLVIGPRASGTQLLLYSIFHIGNANNNITLKSLRSIEKRPEVSWLVPISLGDSHRGYGLVGTNTDYFDHIRIAGDKKLQFAMGGRFSGALEAVIGADVAQKLGYETGSNFKVSHGLGEVSFTQHDREQFSVKGVLARTGTPIDKSILVSLHSVEELHHDWQPGQKHEGKEKHVEDTDQHDEPQLVSAAFVGLKSKIAVLGFQRYINQYPREPLTAVIPGVAFSEIWMLVSKIETVLLVIASLVAITAIVGMIIAILASLGERRREMAILRSLGAGPFRIFLLFVSEAIVLAGIGLVLGAGTIYAGLWLTQDKITQFAGLYIPITAPDLNEVMFLGAIFAGAIVGGLIPAIRAYQISLSDGLSMRL
ncbi:MAG: FtsX-like permease family protein [Hyphomicrobiales bacterium]|nr:FtsX-like permease family protein [Hyphomicrobiales bacterium]